MAELPAEEPMLRLRCRAAEAERARELLGVGVRAQVSVRSSSAYELSVRSGRVLGGFSKVAIVPSVPLVSVRRCIVCADEERAERAYLAGGPLFFCSLFGPGLPASMVVVVPTERYSGAAEAGRRCSQADRREKERL